MPCLLEQIWSGSKKILYKQLTCIFSKLSCNTRMGYTPMGLLLNKVTFSKYWIFYTNKKQQLNIFKVKLQNVKLNKIFGIYTFTGFKSNSVQQLYF